MRRAHSSLLNILLSGTLLLPGMPGWTQVVVVGQKPFAYNVPDAKALAELNKLYQSGQITFEEYQTRLMKLEKSLQAVSDPDTKIVSAPLPSSALDGGAASRFTDSDLTIVLTPKDPQPVAPEPPQLGPLTYTRFGTDLSIKINDDNRPLTAKERDNLILALSLLPTDHLKGITEIDIGKSAPNTSGTGISHGSHVVVFLPDVESRLPGQVITSTMLGIGAHLYKQLGAEEKKVFDVAGGVYNGENGFKSMYQGWVTNSASIVNNAVSIGANGHPEVLVQLFQVMSKFTLTNYRPTKLQSYLLGSDGKNVRSLIESGYFSNPEDKTYQGLWVGDWLFGIVNGQLANYSHFPPVKPAAEPGLLEARSAHTYSFPSRVTLPKGLLERFVEIK